MSTSTVTATPDLAAARERNEVIWRRSARALYAGRIDEFLDYWTLDARYSVAYPVTGLPASVEGHEALRAMFGAFGAAASSVQVHDVRFHQTDDPAVAIVEERMVAELRDGGRYENLLVIRVTFRDDLICDMYEYYGQSAHDWLLRRIGFGA